ncbi:28S ribosomal protein S12, mitochondrial-like isoform X2 [Branchiostoma floridae]|uniref:Small ribosomal subunit protein uS12m n=2 Tax=Branchiostoma floridae TaxID=7739 RepID=A0A9J7N147_BRAFL|nr:28S ribosomal protein S12, mitochondrial-like isoform X2 [Branchiostoma floridae]
MLGLRTSLTALGRLAAALPRGSTATTGHMQGRDPVLSGLCSHLLKSPPPCPLLTPTRTYLKYRTPNLHQLHLRGPPKPKPKKLKGTEGRPQLKGVVLKVFIRKPKKPNSANRKCCRVRLSTGREAIAFIPGEGHNLQEHNVVLVEGKRPQDLPGVKLKVIRGALDCAHVKKKTQ